MAGSGQMTGGVAPRALVMTAIGWLGLAACLTLVFLGMRAVMDVGGACADGGPYVSAQSCPEGSGAALVLGIFGGMGFGFLASVGGLAMGGFWAATPVLAWSALFGSLGWNFLDYGVFSAPETGLEWGWVIPGVVFWAMAIVPLLGLTSILGVVEASVSSRMLLPGPRQSRPSGGRSRRQVDSRYWSADWPHPAGEPGPSQPASPSVPGSPTRATSRSMATGPVGRHADTQAPERRVALAGIADDLGAVIGTAMAESPADPAARAAQAGLPPWPTEPGAAEPGAAAGFSEGTQALLDRLERLADLRDRGLLGPAEYETAKAAIMAELEERA